MTEGVTVKSAEQEAVEFQQAWAAANRENAKLRARIAKLEAALKPFADAAEHFMQDNNSDIFAAAIGHKLYYSDLRAARAAYLGEKK